MAEFMRRFATGDYEYAEIRTDSFEEFVEASAAVADLVASETTSKAVETVKKGFGNTTEVKSGGFGKKSGGFGQQTQPDKVELGDHDGYKVTLYTKGKFGPYVNAYQKGANPERINANLPKGMSPDQVDLAAAVEILSEAA